jgi:hypothetical protein
MFQSCKSVRSDSGESDESPLKGRRWSSLPLLSRMSRSLSFTETIIPFGPAEGAADIRSLSVDVHRHFLIEHNCIQCDKN